jgi:hypothetical protein
MIIKCGRMVAHTLIYTMLNYPVLSRKNHHGISAAALKNIPQRRIRKKGKL